ncbi:MAG: helix-hairpin-helix domain-containing protein [Aquificae bacterium]|nr:helix-hairpin-helix domain-containing protein [Aquificota bacterium]
MSSINWELANIQKLFAVYILIFASLVNFSTEIFFKPSFKKTDLQIDINTASETDLLFVPYIGKKNVKKILFIRKKTDIKSLSQLKKIKFYEKFKYFLKLEKN